MKNQGTFRLVVDGQVAKTLGDLLSALEAAKTARGFTVLPRLVTTQGVPGMDAAAVRADQIKARPDYTIFIGDVPAIYVSLPSEPMGYDPICAHKLFSTDGELVLDAGNVAQAPPKTPQGGYATPWGAVSVVWYPDASLYRQALEKLVSWEVDALRFAVRVLNDDHLAFWITDDWYIQIGNRVRAQVPPALLDDRQELPTTAPDGTDGVLQECAERPVLWLSLLSGGQQNGLFYVGTSSDWRRIEPGAAVVSIFGSAQCQYRHGDNLLVAATTTPGTYAAVYNYQGSFPFGSFLRGKPLGAASLELSQQAVWGSLIYFITDILGDCSMALTDEQLAISDALQRMADAPAQIASLSERVDKLEKAIAAGVSPLPVSSPLERIAVNCGGFAEGDFSGDAYFVGGQVWGTDKPVDLGGADNPAPMAAYQSFRYGFGRLSYLLTGLESGAAYRVRLHFAEMGWGQPGKRVFNVSANGSPQLSNFDPYSAAGAAFRAVVREFTVAADAGGKIDLEFAAAIGSEDRNVFVCAIEAMLG